MKRTFCTLATVFAVGHLHAEPLDQGDLVTFPTRKGVTQSIFIESPSSNPPWVIVLFGGNDGALHLQSNGPTTLKGNFLIRTAGYWAHQNYAAVLADTPSDNAEGVNDSFRLGKDSFTDTEAIVRALRQRFPSSKIALVSTSRGSVSVGNVIERDPEIADAFVLTSPVSIARGRNAGLSGMHVDGTKYRVLVVSNQHDACPASPLYGGQRLAEHNHFDFIAVDSTEGGGSLQADCGGHSPHGFLGIEDRVLANINGWLTGQPVAAQ